MARDRDGPPYQPVFPRCGMDLGADMQHVEAFVRRVIGMEPFREHPVTMGCNTGMQMPQWTLALGAHRVAIAEDLGVLQFFFKPQVSQLMESFQWPEAPGRTARAAVACTRLAGEAQAVAFASSQQAFKHRRASLSRTVGPVGAHMQVAGPQEEAAAASVFPLQLGRWVQRA